MVDEVSGKFQIFWNFQFVFYHPFGNFTFFMRLFVIVPKNFFVWYFIIFNDFGFLKFWPFSCIHMYLLVKKNISKKLLSNLNSQKPQIWKLLLLCKNNKYYFPSQNFRQQQKSHSPNISLPKLWSIFGLNVNDGELGIIF